MMNELNVTIPRSKQMDIYGLDGNRKYRIFLAVPEEPPPSTGYPVIYALDGNAMFATLAETMRLQSSRSDKTGVIPSVIVGIGYPTEAPFSSERFYDFTLPRKEPYVFKNRTFTECGGAELFFQFIEEKLKPLIAQKYRIDTSRQSIVGHSLGGLFVLQTLLTYPSSFRCYIVGSPSIHWNRSYVMEKLTNLDERLEQNQCDISLLIAVGSLETSHQMIENAQALAKRLTSFQTHCLNVEYRQFESEGHISVLPALMSYAVRFSSKKGI